MKRSGRAGGRRPDCCPSASSRVDFLNLQHVCGTPAGRTFVGVCTSYTWAISSPFLSLKRSWQVPPPLTNNGGWFVWLQSSGGLEATAQQSWSEVSSGSLEKKNKKKNTWFASWCVFGADWASPGWTTRVSLLARRFYCFVFLCDLPVLFYLFTLVILPLIVWK